MLNDENIKVPALYEDILKRSHALNFSMLSDQKSGSLLRTLVASKPNGNFLELGTGTGLSLAWIAEGADHTSSIISIDNDDTFQSIARKLFEKDDRITFFCTDATEWLSSYKDNTFDLIFADAWPGKYEKLDETLALVKIGGFYLIDDLLPQPNWPEGHQEKAEHLISYLEQRQDFMRTSFNWSTGLMLFTRINNISSD
ncbi:MAG TPA: class I SAM-dependent methyltransferase [Sphingobacteriaceae bacterium]|nr:class I SAM-dependent methyltransferase [Sphingobacteriaceae bacterium]